MATAVSSTRMHKRILLQARPYAVLAMRSTTVSGRGRVTLLQSTPCECCTPREQPAAVSVMEHVSGGWSACTPLCGRSYAGRAVQTQWLACGSLHISVMPFARSRQLPPPGSHFLSQTKRILTGWVGRARAALPECCTTPRFRHADSAEGGRESKAGSCCCQDFTVCFKKVTVFWLRRHRLSFVWLLAPGTQEA